MHCNNGLNNKLIESLIENKVAKETGDLKYLQDSMYEFVSTLKEIILGEYSPEFFNKYVDEALKLHDSNLDEFLKIPKMGLELRQALNSIDDAINISNQEFKDNLVLLLDRFQTTLDNMEYQARDPYDTAVDLGFQGTKQEWLDSLTLQQENEISRLDTRVDKLSTIVTGTYSSDTGLTVVHGVTLSNIISFTCTLEKSDRIYTADTAGLISYVDSTNCVVTGGASELASAKVTFHLLLRA